MTDNLPLRGKVALVTGAARGIGRAYALRLAKRGADVAVVDFDLHSYKDYQLEAASMRGDTVVDEIREIGMRALGFQADVTDATTLNEAVQQIVGEWGRLDIAICNAGGGVGSPEETRASIVEKDLVDVVVARNLTGTIHTCQAVAVPMKEQRSGKIVTVGSQAGHRIEDNGGYAHYGAAKAAVAKYTQYLARDLGPFGVTVNCVAPGYISTGRLAPILSAMGDAQLLDDVPLGRYGTPEDCAGVIEFLSSDLSDYVTGAIIPVDGGLTYS
uniref:Cyclohexanol dehydrogenase n=1 Tax=Rhodococcus sp. (strain TK6) TaxID=249095 RepID=CHNA_RHOS6|nr:RecName: Full=Cyclohexanol dehydrogenase; AltName: Full=Cyclohexanol dehydrogenase II; Short=CHD II [Rhodococcus sp. TK6]AAR27575.1 cyclohexanol dehydrogenase [Rhodococcus sp. TK6]